jgi:broad specificity phosphatase PhoE
MVRLTLVCSAGTAATRKAMFPQDEPLDARGLDSAGELAARLRSFDSAISGPELRARQTAQALKLGASVDVALRDLDYGEWAGRSLADIDANLAARWRADATMSPPGGESIAELFDRVRLWLGRASLRSGRCVAVTHVPVMRAAVAIALGAPVSSFWQIDIRPLSRVVMHGEGERWRLRSISGARD